MSETAAFLKDWDDLTSEAEVRPRIIPDAAANSIREARINSLDVREGKPIDPTATASASDFDSASTASSLARSRIATFTALQEWDGYVLCKNGSSFTARLTDITASGSPDSEEVEIPYEELDDASIRRLEPGSLFRWSIGYEKSVAGQKTRVSRIIIRQLPRWRKTELERANREATELVHAINWQE